MNGFDNWLLMALMAPVIWSLCCLLDTCLVGKRVYTVASDGAVISGLFSAVPVLMIIATASANDVSLQAWSPGQSGALAALSSGVIYFLHIFWYFKALFKLNDASGTELFLSLTVVLVPIFAFLLLGEQLGRHHYLAIAVAAIALVVLCRVSIRLKGCGAIAYLSLSVVAASLSMVLQAKAFAVSGYAESVLWFNASVLLVSVAFLLWNRMQRQRMMRIFKSMAALVVLAELLEVLGRISAQRAIELGPSVSLVALIECLLPVLVIAISCSVIGLDRKLGVLSLELKDTFALQMQAIGPKLMAMGLIIVSIAIAQPV